MNKIKSFITLSICIVVMWPVMIFAGWVKTYGNGQGTYVRQTADGGYIIAGTELVKTDQDGHVEWRKNYGNDCYCLDETTDGGYVVLSIKKNVETNEYRMWILKLDTTGDTAWTRLYGEGDLRYRSDIRNGCIEQISDGSYVAVCRSFVRVDSLGELLNYENYQPYISYFTCANAYDEEHYIITSPDTLIEVDNTGQILLGTSIFFKMNFGPRFIHQGHTGYVAAGNTWGPGSDTSPNFDAYIAEFEISGDMLWNDTWGVLEYWEEAFCIQPVPPDSITTLWGYYIVCGTNSLRKYTLFSEYQPYPVWEREYEGELIHAEQTSDGGYIITGQRDDEILLIKTDSLGYVGVEGETPQPQANCYISPIGSEIVLRYTDYPQGFHASIFDASGRKIDELYAPTQSGTLAWGSNQTPGVYFIVPDDSNTKASKVILVK